MREVVSRAGAHGALLTSLPDIRWVTGFTGSNGVLLITAERALLLTDPRYEEQVRREVTVVDTESVSGSLLTAAAQTIEGPRSFELLVDSRSLTLEGAEQLNAVGNGAVTLRPEPGILDSLRCRKSDEEIRSIRRAQFITDEVFGELLDTLKPGMSERHVAAEIVYRHMRRGAERMSFEPIVASGPNGALPHARPSNRILAAGDLVVIDMGCVANGYVSDMTRTVAIGSASSKQQEAYEAVRRSQAEAIQAAKEGIEARDLDAIARDSLGRDGFADYFVHSLGHGVGLEVHEWPRIASTSQDRLPEGAVVTIEPGIYLPKQFGIRIEDMVVLRENGCENLTASPRELQVVG